MSGPGVRILWDALPNQSDFFADMIPIRDASLPKQLRDDEAAARRRQYLLVKLGRWLAKLPVSVRLAVGILVNYVRVVERYLLAARTISLLALMGHVLNLHVRLVLYICLSPQFFPEHTRAVLLLSVSGCIRTPGVHSIRQPLT